jgi:hypothetical protein
MRAVNRSNTRRGGWTAKRSDRGACGISTAIRVGCATLSLLKKVFDLGIERPMVGIGNSSLGEYGLDRGQDLAVKLGFGAVLQSEGTVVERNNPRHRTRCSCTATTEG